MAYVIFGVRLANDAATRDLVRPLVRTMDREKAESDPDFLDDLSVPLQLKSGYNIWQPNNEMSSHIYLFLKAFSIKLEDREEWVEIEPPSSVQIRNFVEWVKTTGISPKYKQYLVIDYRS